MRSLKISSKNLELHQSDFISPLVASLEDFPCFLSIVSCFYFGKYHLYQGYFNQTQCLSIFPPCLPQLILLIICEGNLLSWVSCIHKPSDTKFPQIICNHDGLHLLDPNIIIFSIKVWWLLPAISFISSHVSYTQKSNTQKKQMPFSQGFRLYGYDTMPRIQTVAGNANQPKTTVGDMQILCFLLN